MNPILAIILIVVALVAGIGSGFFLGYARRKSTAEAKIGSAELEAKRIVDEAAKDAESAKKNAVIEAKEQILKERNEAERDIKVDAQNRSDILARAPQGFDASKVVLFTEYCTGKFVGLPGVPDPYWSGDDGFDRVLDILENGCRNLLETMKA